MFKFGTNNSAMQIKTNPAMFTEFLRLPSNQQGEQVSAPSIKHCPLSSLTVEAFCLSSLISRQSRTFLGESNLRSRVAAPLELWSRPSNRPTEVNPKAAIRESCQRTPGHAVL
jgi:hypothetical protein